MPWFIMRRYDRSFDVFGSRIARHIAQCNSPGCRVVGKAARPGLPPYRGFDGLAETFVPAFIEFLRHPIRYLAAAEIQPYTSSSFVPGYVDFSAICSPSIDGYWCCTNGRFLILESSAQLLCKQRVFHFYRGLRFRQCSLPGDANAVDV
jgi:hypothetical protein